MERVPSLIRAAALAPLALACGLGCVTVDQASQSVKVALPKSVTVSRPAPASQVICFWQRRLSPLPDPTRDGQQVLGLPGQMFLVGHKEAAAEVDGDLAVIVYDETPRPPGTPSHTAEMWHFGKDTLKQLVTNDERFGRSYALFLPWPPAWQDVTAVKVMARYQSKATPDRPAVDLYAAQQKITIDQSTVGSQVWTDFRETTSYGAPPVGLSAGFDTRGVPDPQKAFQQMRSNQATTPQGPAFPTTGAAPAGGFGPSAPTGVPTASAGSYSPTAGGDGSTAGPGYPGNGGVMQAGGFAPPPGNWGQPQGPAVPGGVQPGPVQPIIIPSRGL